MKIKKSMKIGFSEAAINAKLAGREVVSYDQATGTDCVIYLWFTDNNLLGMPDVIWDWGYRILGNEIILL